MRNVFLSNGLELALMSRSILHNDGSQVVVFFFLHEIKEPIIYYIIHLYALYYIYFHGIFEVVYMPF